MWEAILHFVRDQRGAVGAQIIIGILVLLGFAGLAIDLGRTFTLNTELQQAADATALAAAAELDGFSGAESRATAAAAAFARNNQTFATDGLGSHVTISSIEFLSSIASHSTLLPPQVAPGGDVVATGDSNAYYVRVVTTRRTISGALASFVTGNNVFGTTAVATAGRALTGCMDVALMICNPAEPSEPFATNKLKVGYQVNVTVAGGAAPGNDGFLCPPGSGNCGAKVLGDFLASASAGNPAVVTSCTVNGPQTDITTKPGNSVGQVKQIDTRMDDGSNAASPPSVNVTEYPRDSVFTATGIGNGVWNPTAPGGYWPTNHSGIAFPPTGMAKEGPGGVPTRYDVYNWENDTNHIPDKPHNTPAGTDANRRLLDVAIVNCKDESTNGRSDIMAAEYFQGFMTEKFKNDKEVYLEVVKQLPTSGPTSNGLVHSNVRLVR